MDWLIFFVTPLSMVALGVGAWGGEGIISRFTVRKIAGNKPEIVNAQVQAAVQAVASGDIKTRDIDYASLRQLVKATQHQDTLDATKDRILKAISNEEQMFPTPRLSFVSSVLKWVDSYSVLMTAFPNEHDRRTRSVIYKEWNKAKRRVKVSGYNLVSASNNAVKKAMSGMLYDVDKKLIEEPDENFVIRDKKGNIVYVLPDPFKSEKRA